MSKKIRVNNFDLIVRSELFKDTHLLFVEGIKDAKQTEYRTLDVFHREYSGNFADKQTLDEMFHYDALIWAYSKYKKTIEERYKEQRDMLNCLGINKSDVVQQYKNLLIEEIKDKKIV